MVGKKRSVSIRFLIPASNGRLDDNRRLYIGVGHYFSERPEVASVRRSIAVRLAGGEHTFATDRGVFAYGHLDPGTEFLLSRAPDPPSRGALLDLGCGYGVIAYWLALNSPGAVVWAVDVNERALELARLNASSLPNVRVVAPAQVPADLRFSAIYSNPPVRVGKAALHALLLEWLGRLEPDGFACLVVQRHLGADSLHAWLAGQGLRVERLGSRRGYRLLRVTVKGALVGECG